MQIIVTDYSFASSFFGNFNLPQMTDDKRLNPTN